MWGILLAISDEEKALTGSILTIKSVRLQIEYLGIKKTRIALCGVSLIIMDKD